MQYTAAGTAYNEKVQERIPTQFSSAEEEIAYLREQIAAKERDLLSRAPEADPADLETVATQELREYGAFTPKAVLSQDRRMDDREVYSSAAQLETAHEPVDEVLALASEKGIYNALTVLEKHSDAYLTDEVHRRLIEMIKAGREVQDLKEGVPPWHVLHMTLFEVSMPEFLDKDESVRRVPEIIGMMEQFYAGMQNIGYAKNPLHYVLEIANPEGSDHIIFYIAVPNDYVDLFDKQLHSLYPHAVLIEQQHDYNIFVEGGEAQVSIALQRRHPIFPIRNKDKFDGDPLTVLLNAFSKIEKEGGGASLQVVVKPAVGRYIREYERILERVRNGMNVEESIRHSTVSGSVLETFKDFVDDLSGANKKSQDREHELPTSSTDQDAAERFSEKISSPMLETNIRIAVSAKQKVRAQQILSEVESVFSQFEDTLGNGFVFRRMSGKALTGAIKSFSFREFSRKHLMPLSVRELSTVLHFPGTGTEFSPQFKQSRADTAAAPTDMPASGTLIGVNRHRGTSREIYITPEDRMRHFYIIGQTGTGKSVLMKNLIIQDIKDGAGVCMIDPHGNDIQDVVAQVPPHREQDVIYFDPSNLDQVIGLNMLEYDPQKPEQKTFVVNELFSIFQRLYGSNPESMGPMFEQYFRNATLLVMEDPESGNTLLDISRVMSEPVFRRHKLAHASNPVVMQFWREIATKAGGEASLENIVPYIVSKFDVFTANDYMRPIIGQQKSSFNFRQIMDERKILLVNLSKGRLGEINANLIGMIVVGKILMAALSRADSVQKDYPPFFLHIDEFQNVSTDSIASILSEARKYKLGLTVAHQFIAQLDEKIRDAVFGNIGSIAAFRTGPEDAEFLAHQFSPVFDANDLMNIPNHNAYLKLLANGSPTKPFSADMMPPPESDPVRAQRIMAQSLSLYGVPRAQVDAEIAARYQKQL